MKRRLPAAAQTLSSTGHRSYSPPHAPPNYYALLLLRTAWIRAGKQRTVPAGSPIETPRQAGSVCLVGDPSASLLPAPCAPSALPSSVNSPASADPAGRLPCEPARHGMSRALPPPVCSLACLGAARRVLPVLAGKCVPGIPRSGVEVKCQSLLPKAKQNYLSMSTLIGPDLSTAEKQDPLDPLCSLRL